MKVAILFLATVSLIEIALSYIFYVKGLSFFDLLTSGMLFLLTLLTGFVCGYEVFRKINR